MLIDHIPFEATISALLRQHAVTHGHRPAYTFHFYPQHTEEQITFAELDRRAAQIATVLTQEGLEGQRACLIFTPGLRFIEALFGCFYAGVTPVPLATPLKATDYEGVEGVIADSAAACILTCQELVAAIDDKLGALQEGHLRLINIEDIPSTDHLDWAPHPRYSNLALLQYTSGSTGTPKGVMVTHRGILHNEAIIQEAFGHGEQTVVAGWLPMFHDMGLIGNVLQPLYLGVHSVLMSPYAFVQNPLRWLELISRYRATTAGGPNFGYALCSRRIRDEDKAALDLRSWDLAFTGAEPVRRHTVDTFAKDFAVCGFNRRAFYACYGLAESTLFVTGAHKLEGPRHQTIDVSAMVDNRIEHAPPDSPDAIAVSDCGYARDTQTLRIVDPTSRRACPEQRIGEIWLQGDSTAAGYWQKAQTHDAIFEARIDGEDTLGGFFRTGDLGFLDGGRLFSHGRLKDSIMIRGKTNFPKDIEQAIEARLQLKPDTTAAFSVEAGNEEKLVIFMEARPAVRAEAPTVRQSVNEAVTQRFGIQPFDVVLIEPNALPRGSSGKLQRFKCRQQYLSETAVTA